MLNNISLNLKAPDDVIGNVLVVDDDEIIRAYLESLLVENGYQVSVASGYIEAKDALSEQQFDLVICDLVFVK